MRGKLAIGLAVMIAAWFLPASLRADDSALPQPLLPYAYENRIGYTAPIGATRPAEEIARRTAAADAAETACAGGDMPACTRLGEAFMQGEGRPLNRPVAELVLRKACNGADARGCYLLFALLPNAADGIGDEEARAAMVRSCVLGSSEGCQAQAFQTEAGMFEGLGPEDALALRREACARGLTGSCVDLGDRLAGFAGTPAERAEGRALLERLCDGGEPSACLALASALNRHGDGAADRTRAAALIDRECRKGDTLACNTAASMIRDSVSAEDPRFLEYQGLGCLAGDRLACLFAAPAIARQGEARREVAIAFYDLACPDYEYACTNAADLRAVPDVSAACAGGEQAACVRLGIWMAVDKGPLENRPRAAELLSAACDAGAIAGCLPAAVLVLEAGGDDPAASARTETYLARACTGGEGAACSKLAGALLEGRGLAQDIPRALMLFADRCEAGDREACDTLAKRERLDPAVPLVLATDLLPPTTTPEEIGREQGDAIQAEADAFRARTCTASLVVWEGREYADAACLGISQSIGGFTVNRVELAPFQALLWRPAKLGRQSIGFRTACGGAVVATGWIITAAHCTYDLGVKIEEHDYRIRLGVIRPEAPEGNSYPILKVIRHPDYSPKTYQFDIALVQYDPKRGTKGDFAFGARRIALDTRTVAQRPVRPGAPVFAFGWGRTSLDDPTPAKILQGVKLELEDAAACTNRTAYRDWRKDSVLCAMGPKREQACKGDSGGPLVTYEDQRGVPTLIGVVSSGEKCSTTGVPSRYIRIGHKAVQEWLSDNLPGFRRGATALPQAR